MKRDLLPRPPRSTQLITVTAIALAVLGSFSIVSAGFVWKQAFDNTQKGNINFSDPSRYREIRYKLWSNQNLVKHFPPDIPVESSRVYLAYSRASEQGSSFLQLRLKLPNRQIQNLLQQYRAIAKYSSKVVIPTTTPIYPVAYLLLFFILVVLKKTPFLSLMKSWC